MPDQSTAASEHALMQEITEPFANLPDDPVPAVADPQFPVALRGYDRLAVDAYVKETSRLVAELQATRSPEAAVRRALGRVGEEVASILQRAHETAEHLTAQSRAEAEERLEAARREAAEITAGANRQLSELDSETDRIWAERHRIVEDAQELARSLLALAESATERFPAAATDESEAPPAGEPEGAVADDEDWEAEELDHWDSDEFEDHEHEPLDERHGLVERHDETEATAAMPRLTPTEETKKLD
jgi:cell division septum initiation protein DivIVA